MKKVSWLIVSMATVTLMASGCTHVARKRAKAEAKLEEHSRALTTAVVDCLQMEGAETRDPHSEVALKLAREDQRIEGLPSERIDVEAFFATDATNAPSKARTALAKRFRQVERLVAEREKATERLVQFGEAEEQTRNAARARWWKLFGSGSVLLGGVVAVCVFVPAVLPILGRVLAWLVGKIPSLAGAVGVVGVKAFDAMVKGVERTREKKVELSNAGRQQLETAEYELEVNLSREMDAAHKALVRSRKVALSEGRAA